MAFGFFSSKRKDEEGAMISSNNNNLMHHSSMNHQQQQPPVLDHNDLKKLSLAPNNSNNHTPSPPQEISDDPSKVAGRYAVKERLGKGSFGEVRLAIDSKTGTEVAIKFEHKSDLKKHLQTEYDMYQDVQGPGFPVIYWFGKHGDYTAMVMERCGCSLKYFYSRCNRIFPVQTVALIAIQILDRLEAVHNGGWLHQDIKPENIVCGVGEHRNLLYLIDYGTSSQYVDPVSKKHRTRGPSTKIVGTARYSSLNNHYGYKQSRRDDLESFGYTLIYWLLGRLPWQGIPENDFRIKWKKVRRIKRSITPDELCRGLPVQFRIYMKYVFKLSYAQRPNYSYLRGLFRQLIQDKETDKQFCWEKFGLNKNDKVVSQQDDIDDENM